MEAQEKDGVQAAPDQNPTQEEELITLPAEALMAVMAYLKMESEGLEDRLKKPIKGPSPFGDGSYDFIFDELRRRYSSDASSVRDFLLLSCLLPMAISKGGLPEMANFIREKNASNGWCSSRSVVDHMEDYLAEK